MNIQELKKQAQEALENGDLAKAKELLAQIKSVKETEQEQKAIEAELAELTDEPVEEEPAEEVAEEEVAEPETEEPAETEEVEEELEKDEKGEERTMKEIKDLTSKVQDFEAYIRTQGTETRGLDTTNGSILVPVEVSTSVLELKDGQVDLSKYVTKEAVGTGQGKFPVAKRAQAILATKAELAEIAEIDEPLFLEVDYKVETRIGQIAFSNELLEDAEIDVVAYAKRSMERMVTNTNNANIMTVLNDFAKVNATNADELKRVVNVDLDPELDLKIVLNQDAYQAIDTLKDADGRYLLQDSIASASGKSLFGKEVVVISNKVAKTPKDTAGFIFVGDLKEAVFMAQRNEISAEWEKFDRYSKGLAVGIRSDYKKIDADAGKLVNFTLA
ncbi:phage major capsid protein [Enterococcus casseliflavus]|uniref:phage major capsid protein n=1 Tax=Enterococcus TaxID=1350 RepID=UPI001CBE979C|nr:MULTISPECIES: phage major capsid protein [Enterococcus]MBZ3642437.1 phage major capsid protein [Enterococcus casseliflavus]MCD5185869.1 phage major capsid protein [Enterococcus gallinarum]